MAEFPRVARLDARLLLSQLAAAGTVLSWDGACPGGQVGAAYVRWPDGHRSVLTCAPPGRLAAVRQVESMLAVARGAGVPAPRYELTADLPSGIAIVQEQLPDSPPAVTSRRTAESMVEISQRCRGLLAGRDDLPPPSLYLREDGPGFCLHEPLARHSPGTAQLLAAIEETGAQVPERLAGDDLVHFDFHPENVLADAAGTVTGVVDWDGAARSNAAFDLYTLRFDLAWRAPELGRRLGAVIAAALPADVVAACWAHLSLRLVDWSIRHLTASHVSTWLGVAEELRP